MVLLLVSSNMVEAARVVAEKRECATCHIAWMSDFKKTDVLTLIPYDPRPIEKTGRQDVVSTERMCFSCHDGFALDSRPLWLEGRHNHPVGMEPSDKVVLPKKDGKTVFPLNEEGKVYCGTCHSAHGLSWKEQESPIFLRVPNVDSSMCMTCHEKYAEKKKGINHPVMKKLDELPEKLVAVGGMFTKEKEIICQSCHTPHAARSRPLMVMDNRRAWLCSNCHADKARIVGTKHDYGLIKPEAVNMKGEKVSEYGTCLGCHVLHGADPAAPLWGGSRIASDDRVAGVCKSCHNKDGLAKKKLVGGHSHPLDVPVTRLGIEPHADGWKTDGGKQMSVKPLPLLGDDGQKSPDGTRVACLTCHDPHVWSVKSKDQDGSHFREEGDGDSSFLRIAQGSNSALCANCHTDKRMVAQSPHGLKESEKARIRKTGKVDRVLDQGACGSCHRAHNGRGPLMMPVGKHKGQSPFQSLCYACHTKGGVAGKKLTGEHSHPMLKSLKNVGGRSSLPLFDKSGRRTPKGRLDCPTCHNPHQWNPKKAVVSASEAKKEGDATTSFLRMPAAPNSDLCVDCHRNKRFVLGTDHDMNVTAASARNSRGQSVKQSGVCGQCHGVHNAESDLVLWGRSVARGGRQDALCLDCHRNGGVAQTKVPVRLNHPPEVLLWSNGARAPASRRRQLPYTPVFNHQGRRAFVGSMSCASCHNPHVWNPSRPSRGPGKNREGDATNSFLRNASSENIVCADCHGEDGLFRYKYFHGLTSRRNYFLYKE
jgi:predicted CXXCH cytochrome family protein